MDNKKMEKLDIEDLASVTGGGIGSNTYGRGQYHAVGLSTEYHTILKDEFYFTLPNGSIYRGHRINHEDANWWVDYYNTYGEEEYIRRVRMICSDFTKITWGYDL